MYVGGKDDLYLTNEKEYAFIHATKSLFKEGDDRVLNEVNNHLYVNWVDSRDSKYFDYNGNGVYVFIKILDFIDKWIGERKVFIHCDEGVSRSPSIAMVYMAKRKGAIRDKDHVFAKYDFTNIYCTYFANKGIDDFLFRNWFKIK